MCKAERVSWWSTIRSVGDTLGISKRNYEPVGCLLGQSITAYYRNPLEAEAYTFDARFRDDDGQVVATSLPIM